MSNEPEILVEARKLDEKPSPLTLAMLGAPQGFQGDLWEITVVCQHGSQTIPVMIGRCASHGEAPALAPDEMQRQVDSAVESARQAYLQLARCACSDPFWLRKGKPYDLASHLGPTQIMGHDGQDCFSLN